MSESTPTPAAAHPSGYVKGCQCEKCQAYRARSRERAKTYKHPDPAKRRKYKTGKQAEYDARTGKAARDKAWRQAHPDEVWAHTLKSHHGMTPDQWLAMLMEQEGNCYLCRRPLPEDRSKVAIDHDHRHCKDGWSCGYCRRGLAHHGCNAAIGLLLDNPALMRTVADNLEHVLAITDALLLTAPVQGELFATQ